MRVAGVVLLWVFWYVDLTQRICGNMIQRLVNFYDCWTVGTRQNLWKVDLFLTSQPTGVLNHDASFTKVSRNYLCSPFSLKPQLWRWYKYLNPLIYEIYFFWYSMLFLSLILYHPGFYSSLSDKKQRNGSILKRKKGFFLKRPGNSIISSAQPN